MSKAWAASRPVNLQASPSPSLDDAQTAQFFEMLAAMASAGIPIVKALDGLSEHPGLVRPVFSTVRALESGHSLTRSFALGGFQDPVVIGMLQLGESTGTLSNVIELLNRKKKSVVFVNKEKDFKTVGDIEQLIDLVACMSNHAKLKAEEKIRLSEKIDALRQAPMFA